MTVERVLISDRKEEKLAMDTPSIVVPPGQDPVSPGRSFSLKLRGGETGDSIMMFEETVPAVTKSTFHLHRDSDEVAYILSDEVTVGGPAPAPSCHAACRMPGRAPARKPNASGALKARAKMHKEG